MNLLRVIDDGVENGNSIGFLMVWTFRVKCDDRSLFPSGQIVDATSRLSRKTSFGVVEAARSALECGSSSYRLPTSFHTTIVPSRDAKAVAAATALQVASRILFSRRRRGLASVSRTRFSKSEALPVFRPADSYEPRTLGGRSALRAANVTPPSWRLPGAGWKPAVRLSPNCL
jgi:hypothetical protein